MSKKQLIIFIVAFSVTSVILVCLKKYQTKKPSVVPFRQGMSLEPGQSTVIPLIIILDDGNGELKKPEQKPVTPYKGGLEERI